MPERLDTSLHVRVDARRTDSDRTPYGFVVNWIPWDSGFRGTELRVDDVITAVDALVFTPEKKDPFDFGQYSEEQFWDKAGAKDGTPTTFTVVRGDRTLRITGKVRADRFYTSDDGKRTIGLDGPQEMARDGFDESWTFWRERVEKDLADSPDAVYHQNTRLYLERLEAHRPRVEYLTKSFPRSAFAKAIREDFDRAVDLIRGRRYDLTEDDLGYRRLSAARVEKAQALAGKARDEFVKASGAVALDGLANVDPIRGDRKANAGKIVTIPQLGEEIAEAGHGWYAPRAAGRVFLVDTRSRAFVAISRAMERFKQRITPALNDVFELIGKVTDRPAMVATGRAVYTGVLVEPLAALVDGKMFVDVSGGGEDAPFAGEADAVKPPSVTLRPDMTPAEVFRQFINALKLGDQDLWQSFFAPWSCEPTGIGDQWVYDAEGGPVPNAHNLDYVIARRVIMSSVYDVRVLTEGAPRKIYEKDGTAVEMVELDVDPIGLFDGEYRSFRSVDVHRLWHLQRVNGGPWRIVSDQGL